MTRNTVSLIALLAACLSAGCGGGGGGSFGPIPTAPPDITMWVHPSWVDEGSATRLYWVAFNATSVVASNFGATATHGDERRTPVGNTTYTLRVRGPGGEATQSCTVDVYSKPDVRGTWEQPHNFDWSFTRMELWTTGVRKTRIGYGEPDRVELDTSRPTSGYTVVFDPGTRVLTRYGGHTAYVYKVGPDAALWEQVITGPVGDIEPGQFGSLPPGMFFSGEGQTTTVGAWKSTGLRKP